MTTETKKHNLTRQIFIGLALGIVAGALVERFQPAWAIHFRPFSSLFLRLIKMLLAPLIFSTLVAGIAGAGHVKTVGRMGLRAMVYIHRRDLAGAGGWPATSALSRRPSSVWCGSSAG